VITAILETGTSVAITYKGHLSQMRQFKLEMTWAEGEDEQVMEKTENCRDNYSPGSTLFKGREAHLSADLVSDKRCGKAGIYIERVVLSQEIRLR
jgi:hypothetical protein